MRKKVLLPAILFLTGLYHLCAQPVFYGLTFQGGEGIGTISKFESGSNTLSAVYTFPNDPIYPSEYGAPILAADGKLYGMTSSGGSSDRGTLFSFEPATSELVKLHDFNNSNGAVPRGSLVQAGNGKLYGMTLSGGSSGQGTLFSFDPATNTHTKLHDFSHTNGANPYGSLVQAGNGKLYGMTPAGGNGYGTIFSFDPVTNTHTKLHDFNNTNGAVPYGSLVQAGNGKLYGMTLSGGSSGQGTLFSFDPSTNAHVKLHDFNNTDGRNPNGSLVQADNGKLYGMTSQGGSSSSGGTIFSFDPATNTHTKLHDFSNTDGRNPYGSLVQAGNGKLYGMTQYGGNNGYGTIFSFDPSINTNAKLHDFNNTDGRNPYGSLVQAGNGKLYGMTMQGGNSDRGTIFSFDPSNNAHVKLHDFTFTEGANPNGSLAQAGNGKLYGMTHYGGNNGYGTIFSFDPATNTHNKLHDFNNTDGRNPYGSLMQSGDGKLYGMTRAGGSGDYGTIFSFDPSTNTHTKLHEFNYSNGAFPYYGSLVQAGNGKLYGMTQYGGNNGYGTIFSFDPSTNMHAKLLDFNITNGANPYGSLVQAGNGKLYGMTFSGGSSGLGTLFSFDPSTNAHAKLHDFDNAHGASPPGNLVQAGNGMLYGMTLQGGTSGRGTIFSFDPSTNTYAKLHDFDVTNGANPYGSLVQSGDGNLYGMTTYGGSNGFGTIFSFDPSTNVHTKLQEYYNTNGIFPLGDLIELNACIPATFYADADGDSYGNPEITIQACTAPDGYVDDNTDCDDTKATVNPGATEVCNGIDDDCDGQVDEGVKTTYYQDADGDGFGNAAVTTQACTAPAGYVINNTDCDDTKATVYPGATETCGNGIDDDCDGQVDENCTVFTFYADADGDGYGNAASSVTNFTGIAPAGYVNNSNDCNDNNAAVNPGATEVCNGIDDDCDGQVDEGVQNTYYQDADGDGFGNAAVTTQACTAPAGYVSNNTDCDDTKATVYPGAPELCDGLDNDCNGLADDGITFITYYKDNDNDGYGDAAQSVSSCVALSGYVTAAGDCNDNNAAVNPGATEVCNGIDDDCDGQVDEGVQNTYYQDADGDGYGNPAVTTQACTAPAGYVSNNTDCDDTKATVYPGATETCGNGIDDDCDGQVDEGVQNTYYQDADGDGYGNPAVTTQACTAPAGYVSNNTDCDDTKATVYPGATETCGNGIDDDCDGQVDENCTVFTFYADADGDGYGDPASSVTNFTGIAPAGYVSNGNDCNDNNAAVNPGATEVCNGIDDDCDGQVDEGVQNTYYLDADGDGYGNSAIPTQACTAPSGYVSNNTDCDDTKATVHPGAAEVCGNSIDDNCNGQVDENCTVYTFYADKDKDGYGNAASSVTSSTNKVPKGYVSNNTDCNDNDKNIHPGAKEVCDGKDNNCNGQVDEGVKNTYYRDADGDGYGNPAVTTQACTAPSGYVSNSSDCDDSNKNIKPGAKETCSNGIDDNCNGQVDENCTVYTFYADKDKDGYGNAASSVTSSTNKAPKGYVSNSTDCNDNDKNIHPGAKETCSNGIDDNCNGQVDENCTVYTFYADKDKDGYGNAASSVTSSTNKVPKGYVSNNTDCNDNDKNIHPGAKEVCDGKDNNCDGQVDEGVKNTYYRDADGDGYGNPAVTTQACTAPSGYISNSSDCDDSNKNIKPGAKEKCNGIDDNCNGQVDEGCKLLNVPKIAILPTAVAEGNSGTTNAVFTLTLSKTSNVPVTVQYKTEDGTATAPQDYIGKAGTVTFPANSLVQTIAIAVVGDMINENSETFKVVLSSPAEATLSNDKAQATITDNDKEPGIYIADTSFAENIGTAKLRVKLTVQSGKTVTVKYSTKDGTAKSPDDYTAISNGSLSFQPGETVKYISVALKTDKLKESAEKFGVNLKDAINASLSVAGARKDATAQIMDSPPSSGTNSQAMKKGETPFVNESVSGLQVVASPNPSMNYFTISVSTASIEPILLSVTDISGRIIEQHKMGNDIQPIQVGQFWASGVYFLEIGQGHERKVIKLIKAQ